MKNYTQEHMAEKLNLSPTAYGKIERNETKLSVQRLEEVATILGIKSEDILNFDDTYLFNNVYNNNQGVVINNGISENERKLYDDLVGSLKNQITLLQNEISMVKSK